MLHSSFKIMRPISRPYQLTEQFTLCYLPELGRIHFHFVYAVMNKVRIYLYKNFMQNVLLNVYLFIIRTHTSAFTANLQVGFGVHE